MTTQPQTPPKKSVRFGGTTEYHEADPEVRLSMSLWWQQPELNQGLEADMKILKAAGGDTRGLEHYFRKHAHHNKILNMEYTQNVLQRYKMYNGVGKLLPMSKEKSLQKYCTRYSRKNQTRALRLGQEDEKAALEIYMFDRQQEAKKAKKNMAMAVQQQQQQTKVVRTPVVRRSTAVTPLKALPARCISC